MAVAVHRTYLTARSVEFDAVVLTGSGTPAKDAGAQRDAKAASSQPARVEPRLLLLVAEAFRHGKAVGATGAGTAVLDAAGVDDTFAGVSSGAADDVIREVLAGLASHRAWDRFEATQ